MIKRSWRDWSARKRKLMIVSEIFWGISKFRPGIVEYVRSRHHGGYGRRGLIVFIDYTGW